MNFNPNRAGLLDVALVQGGLNQPAPSRSTKNTVINPISFDYLKVHIKLGKVMRKSHQKKVQALPTPKTTLTLKSRFTASRKYEEFFSRCFQLSESRGGDICNACVLLVKRFKKLPVGTSQHWAHVVDAR